MDTCHLRNKKMIVILILSLIVGLFIFMLYQNNCKNEMIDGNFTKPMIRINGSLYETTIDKQGEITENYIFYGYVKDTVREMIGIPDSDLMVSKIIESNVGYKVYISKDQEFVAIFNDHTQKYDYFEKMSSH